MLKTHSQKGSVHVVVIVILILAIVGALGFVFWNNFMVKNTADTSQKPPASKAETPAKKSEVIALAGDMNKYVNYEQGFEFLFPKMVEAPAECVTKSTVYNAYGKEIPSRSYYTTSTGSMALDVLEGDSRYVVAPKETFVLSNIAHEGSYDLAGACAKQPATLELMDFKNELNGSKRVENTVKREFEIIQAGGMEAITNFARKTLGDSQATVTLGAARDGRQAVAFNHGPGIHMGISGYSAWYYPAKEKLVYMNMGQNVVFISPTVLGLYYDSKVADSFKFATN